ncbi:MAG: hypothetical protein AAF242_10625 [Bacteroidota bacterium]
MQHIIDPIELYNALHHLGLRTNEEMHLSDKEEERLDSIYHKVILAYFKALFPSPTKQHFIGKRRDEHGRMLVEIICRSCGKSIVVNNRRMVFCPSPAPCKNNFHADKSSVFEFLSKHSLDLAFKIRDQPVEAAIEALLEKGKTLYQMRRVA